MPQPRLFRIIDRAVHDYQMIENGDNILVGVSGGKDSTALLQYFAQRKKQNREKFDFTALHVASEFSSLLHPNLLALFASWGIEPVVVKIDVQGRLKPGRPMSCWWCSTQRRTELNNYAIAHGFNKIALGHHLDDILETLLMNALDKGELSTMPPRLAYKKYPISIIRPLCMVEVATIIQYAAEQGFLCNTCTCDFQDNSARKEARRRLSDLTHDNSEEKRRLFMALRNVRMEYLTYCSAQLDALR